MHTNIFLTDQQRKGLKFIADYRRRYRISPELDEIKEAVGTLDRKQTFYFVEKLVKKGMLSKKPGRPRGISITNTDFIGRLSTYELPILGLIAAGKPIEPLTDKLYLTVSAVMVKDRENTYALRVKGDSMIEEGILDGDYVIVEHREDAQNGDIVVALLKSGLATLKQIYFEDKGIKLMPANKKCSPIYVDEVKIQGKVIGVIRQY